MQYYLIYCLYVGVAIFSYIFSDMLRTLWKNVNEFAHKNVRFFPTFIFIFVLAFLIPLSFYNDRLTANLAEAWGWSDVGQSILSVLGSALGWILKVIAWTIFQITGLIFSAAGLIFDKSVLFSLSGSLYSSFTFINSGWIIIRDLINSLFIFSVLYVALKQLFSFSGDFDKKVITNIIIAALLINFSLFFTKAVIDVSNFTSRAIYYTMKNQPTDGGEATYGPANALANGLNIQSILKDDPSKAIAANDSTGIQDATQLDKALLYFGGSIVNIVCSVIFFAISFFFVARIVVLIILMLTSPVYFLSYALSFKVKGKMGDLGGKWKNALIDQAVFPVIFMLIIYIAVQIVNSGLLSGKDVEGTFQDGINGGANGFAIIINFSIVIALMIFALKTAKEYAGQAGSLGSAWAGKVGAGALSASAFAGRHTLGRAGGVIASSKTANAWASSDSKFKRFVGDKVLVSGGKAMYEGTWDARNQKQISTAYGMANKSSSANINVGKGGIKNAKVNVREWGEKTAEGKKKEVAYESGKINYYGTSGAKVAEARARIGDNINNKEYKEFREKLITEIRTEYKDDPEMQKKLISKLISDEAYNKAEFAKTRNEITKGIDTNTVKKGVKDIHEVKESLKTKNADLAKAVAQPPHLQDPALIAKLKSEIEPLENKSKTFDTALERNPAAVRELAVADITKLQGQLGKAHLAALNDKISKGEFEDEDIVALSKMVKDMRKNPKTDKAGKELAQWIASQEMKGTSNFNLELAEDLSELLNSRSAGYMDEVKKIIKVMSKSEFAKLSVDDVLNEDIFNNVNHTYIKDFAKKIHDGNDVVAKSKLHSMSNEFQSMRKTTGDIDKDINIAYAYKGEDPPKKVARVTSIPPRPRSTP